MAASAATEHPTDLGPGAPAAADIIIHPAAAAAVVVGLVRQAGSDCSSVHICTAHSCAQTYISMLQDAAEQSERHSDVSHDNYNKQTHTHTHTRCSAGSRANAAPTASTATRTALLIPAALAVVPGGGGLCCTVCCQVGAEERGRQQGKALGSRSQQGRASGLSHVQAVGQGRH